MRIKPIEKLMIHLELISNKSVQSQRQHAIATAIMELIRFISFTCWVIDY